MRCLYTVFGYKHFLTNINYFRQLYVTFDGYILILALPDWDFVKIQDFLAISRICGLKARLEFNINLLALIQFCLFCSSLVSSINSIYPFENAVLLEILKY